MIDPPKQALTGWFIIVYLDILKPMRSSNLIAMNSVLSMTRAEGGGIP